MLPQQIIAIAITAFFIIKLYKQKRKGEISNNEYIMWLVFWITAALAIAMIKQVDRLSGTLGLSASGIDFLVYLAVIMLFYFVFRLRLRLAKMDRELTEMVRQFAIKETDKKQAKNNN